LDKINFQKKIIESDDKQQVVLFIEYLNKFYKIKPEKVIIIHDDIDLALGKLRIAFDSSAGGHNGIKSIIDSLGTQKFCRIKIGVADAKLKFMDAADYVLDHFDKKQEKIIDQQAELAAEAVIEIIKTSPTKAMNKYN
jgi:PTH1 family peptidyl-tRNA hydrolase